MLRGSLFFVSLVNVTGQRRDKQRRQNAKNDQHNNELYQRKAPLLFFHGFSSYV